MKAAPRIGSSLITKVINPETELERLLLSDEEVVNGLLWGTPRFGHPEGAVWLHVWEVLDNVELVSQRMGDPRLREQLRLVSILHDTFKYQEEKIRPRRNWDLHHANIARRFAEKYIDDTAVLDVIELHDEAFYAWRERFRDPERSQWRLNRLFDRLGEGIQLFYLFFKCDTQTGDKIQAPVAWFEETCPAIEALELPWDQPVLMY